MSPKYSIALQKTAVAIVPFFKRALVTICLAAIPFVLGCANQGTIVRKQFRPFPFPISLGLEGLYRFEVRDRAGQIRSQMVTPDVFDQYEVGDYFNDRKPAPASRRPAGPAYRITPSRPRQLQEYGTHYRQY
jgi:hypothetical protein